VKTIGVVGGIGPESTVDYYRLILASSRKRGIDRGQAVLINSIDVTRLLDLAGSDNRDELADFLLQAVESLARAGADLALFAANTPHLVFDEVQCRASIPLVSIVAATCEVAEALGLKRVGLLGTRFTMQGRFYPDVFSPRGVAVVVPGPEDQAYVHEKYVRELVPGTFQADPRDSFVRVLNRMRESDDIEGVILGGTELPLLLRDVVYPLPLLDTTRIHVDAAVSLAAG
jgi:aspartate racemase